VTHAPPAGSAAPRPRRFWIRALPVLARHLMLTMPWVTLFVGCASGTLVLAVMAHFAGRSPLDQGAVRVTLLPAMAALAFVPHVHFRPLIQATPVPAWIAGAGQTLLAAPVLAVTCWAQLRLMTSTLPEHSAAHLPAVYPLLAEFTGWSVLTVAVAACCERTRYAALSGAIATAVSLALIAAASYTTALKRHLLTPPATPDAATLAWYTIAAAALLLTFLAVRDQWHRYTRRLHR
jgi:hypothetical protein